VIGDDSIATLCSRGPLSVSHSVESLPNLQAAHARVRALQYGIVVTDLQLPDGDGIDVCRAAKYASRPILVLVSTDDVRRVPRALSAGCDSVLVKPFAPNLFYARLGRLTRDLQIRSAFPASTIGVGTNQHFPALACPGCGHSGATGFDATGLRRVWYACLACEHVWIAKRQQ
jgi:DNA-binding response OmpR family regulator